MSFAIMEKSRDDLSILYSAYMPAKFNASIIHCYIFLNVSFGPKIVGKIISWNLDTSNATIFNWKKKFIISFSKGVHMIEVLSWCHLPSTVI